MVVPQNGCFIRKTRIKMDDLGVPPFKETPIWGSSSQQNLFTLKGIETEEKTRFSKNRWFPGKSHPPEKGTLPSTWGRGYDAENPRRRCAKNNHRRSQHPEY